MDKEKLLKDIERFLEVYKILGPEAKAVFEAQLAPHLATLDQKTRELYRALLNSAQDGLSVVDTIANLEAQRQSGRPE
ncbi:hypothetical protein A2276_01530 [candidate division WOR-1 bacterium RIFOXYA12_FULL_43_27]|uniref:Uncharacterized protein n=1 Tax=candidate division WOR-1 bacterium RIFOXYC2_FULL_46_14 TaxID=1802587 RepID=A0A1F4U6Z9_UNCSA|nr:MAG: hypothetical protein A2276_01530 [candidate division WOR-1 bacterium RIFOXYA12_FULL_43_27]OGC19593.1 MAG: hypothetical protein A2292_02800 [candidate division WOR-1 bacterium RIFOXYB2_FULL_46_45]OGC30582.1 MAG: hypothetical protein A2232_02800 [candidate division WOR-1 bacterium RIFOXYA2_FULL_46_56]OGC40649.1 MAG: hypothetical protein A2438_06515 [candidate division WOR-1 bacterium RIFOXYC2_FULL_46_14]